MKKNLHTALILFSTLLIFACSTIALSESIQIKNASTKYKAGGGYYDFNPEIANAMKLNWFSSADNRAMLTLVLALQVADDRVMGSEDVASGFLVNTSYLGKTYKSNMNVYIALGRTDDYFIYIIYSPDAKQASFFLQDNTYGNYVSDMQMELLIAKLCSNYYKNDSSNMFNALIELQNMM